MATPEQMQNLKSMLAGSSVPKNTSIAPSQTTDWSSYTPPAPKVSVAPAYTPPSSMTEAESRLSVTPSAPAPQTEGNDWSMKKLFQPTMTAGKAVGNFLTSSEQKLGKIVGDSMAGVEDQAAVNDANERVMQAKLQHQIALNRQEGKDTSHLEWALSKSMQNFKGAQQQIAEQAPGSLATNEEAAGALGGVALDIGTLGMGGGADIAKGALPASRTATEILKETGKTALKGSGVGAAYGATGAMQENESAGGVVGQAALGGVLGFAVPALLGTASAVKQLVSPNTDVAIKKYTDFTKELGQNYKDISKSTEKAAKFGKDPRELLVQKAEQGSYIPVKMKLNGTYDTTSEAIPKMWQDTNDLLALKRAVNNTNSQRVSLDEAKNAVLERIKGTADVGDYKKVSKLVNAEFNNLASDPRLQTNALTMNDLGDIVSKQWKESSSLFTKTNRPDFASNAHYQIGQAVNDVIDKYSDDVRVKDLNQLIGHHLETIKFLENLNGKAPTGKYFGKKFAQVIGAMAGSHAGPGGMIAGSEMGKRAADLAHAYSGHDPFVGSVLEDIAKANPQIVLQAQDYLEKNAGKLSTEGLNKGANMVTKLPLKSTKGVLDLSGGKAEIPSGKKSRIPVQKSSTIIPPAPKIPLGLPEGRSSLTLEAMNHKTPEEFVKAQGEPVYQHRMLRSTAENDLQSIMENGFDAQHVDAFNKPSKPFEAKFSKQPNVNLTNTTNGNYISTKKGETVLLPPKSEVINGKNGPFIKPGWKPTESQIVKIEYDGQKASEALKNKLTNIWKQAHLNK